MSHREQDAYVSSVFSGLPLPGDTASRLDALETRLAVMEGKSLEALDAEGFPPQEGPYRFKKQAQDEIDRLKATIQEQASELMSALQRAGQAEKALEIAAVELARRKKLYLDKSNREFDAVFQLGSVEEERDSLKAELACARQEIESHKAERSSYGTEAGTLYLEYAALKQKNEALARECEALKADAALGAMVRKMPFGSMLRHDDPECAGPVWWMQHCRKRGFIEAETPEEVLRQADQLKDLSGNPEYPETARKPKTP